MYNSTTIYYTNRNGFHTMIGLFRIQQYTYLLLRICLYTLHTTLEGLLSLWELPYLWCRGSPGRAICTTSSSKSSGLKPTPTIAYMISYTCTIIYEWQRLLYIAFTMNYTILGFERKHKDFINFWNLLF